MTNAGTMRLADLCDLVTESVRPGERPDAVYVGLEHLASGRFLCKGAGSASEVRSTTASFRPRDVLYGKLRPYLDKAVLAQEEGVCTTELLVLRTKAGVDPRFLVGVLHAPAFVEWAVSGITGAQHPRTSWSHIRDFRLPAFAPEESRQLAEFLWMVQAAIGKSDGLVESGRSLKHMAMRTLFVRGLRGETTKETEIGPIPESWTIEKIGDLFEIEQGLSLQGNLASDDSGTRFLRTSNVYWGRVEIGTVSHMRLGGDPPPRKILRRGDLLVCEGGEIGRAAVWDDEVEQCVFQNHLHRLRPRDAVRTSPRFVMGWLEEGFVHRTAYQGVANKTTIPNLSRGRWQRSPSPTHPMMSNGRSLPFSTPSTGRSICTAGSAPCSTICSRLFSTS